MQSWNQQTIQDIGWQRTRRFCQWWVMTTESWNYQQMLNWITEVCWDNGIASIARSLIAPSEITASFLEQVPVVVKPVIPL